MPFQASITYGRLEQGHKTPMLGLLHAVTAGVGKNWIRQFLPLHYKNLANSRYDYVKRNKWYNLAKFKKFGHTRPHTHSGTAAAAVKQARVTKVTANNNSVFTAEIPMPRVYNLRIVKVVNRGNTQTTEVPERWRRKGPKPLLNEVSTVTAQEIQTLETQAVSHFDRAWARINQSKTRTRVLR